MSSGAPGQVFLYEGRRLEEFTKEKLIDIATQGWQMYHAAVDSSIRSMQLMQDLHEASHRHEPRSLRGPDERGHLKRPAS